MKSITPFLWFNTNAEEAINLYTSIFKNSKIGKMSRYGEAGPGPKGSVMTAQFWINGQEFLALNGGPQFKFNEAVSFLVGCDTQEEIDELWDKLSAGGEQSQCGWLKDKFGLFWQIVPANMGELMAGNDPEKSKRAMTAMLQMTKLDMNVLKKAYDGDL